MSEKYVPKVGDRVRVTVEATVAAVWPKDDLISLSNSWDVGLDDAGVTIEKVTPPLPTTPGSVIEYGWSDEGPGPYDRIRMLLADGTWITPSGIRVDTETVRLTAERYGFDVRAPGEGAK